MATRLEMLKRVAELELERAVWLEVEDSVNELFTRLHAEKEPKNDHDEQGRTRG